MIGHEDDERIVEFVRRGLQAEGYNVDVARDGQEALEVATSPHYKLIILDLMLPGVGAKGGNGKYLDRRNALLLFMNNGENEQKICLPAIPGYSRWHKLLDSCSENAKAESQDGSSKEPADSPEPITKSPRLAAQSLQLFSAEIKPQ